MLKRVLVANRGEIALRIIRACHEEGIGCVAVCSEADRASPHVRAADAAVVIGEAPAARSYLDMAALVRAALETGCDAVHPGYGFLSERAAFAEAVEAAGLVWVGPPPSAIRAMGDKTAARRTMAAAGVPIVPGATEPLDAAGAERVGAAIGFPLMVKAAAGGGGKGMRIVRHAGELPSAIATAAREAEKAFGDASVYVERFVERPRHVEIQVLADAERTVSVGERECSVQRRHQKLVEEAPSVAVDAALRARMGEAAVNAARAVGYRGAGTCEFLLAAGGEFYFLEMNTRIQVEHPVTELVYGIDLVREQLRIAGGMPMSLPRGPMQPRGWAIECRITAEDVPNGFLPATGRLALLRPPAGPGIRWDAGVETGNEVSLHYDSMLAKLIVWAEDRPRAIERMLRALDELVVAGLPTNQGFHRRLFHDPAFRAGEIDIQFLDRRPDLASPEADDALVAAIAAALAEAEARGQQASAVEAGLAQARQGGSAWVRAARQEGVR